MRFRWANAVLLLLLLAALASGLLGLVTGSEDLAIFILAHRVVGYGILLILIWKAGNIAFSLRRARSDDGTGSYRKGEIRFRGHLFVPTSRDQGRLPIPL